MGHMTPRSRGKDMLKICNFSLHLLYEYNNPLILSWIGANNMPFSNRLLLSACAIIGKNTFKFVLKSKKNTFEFVQVAS